MSHKPATITIDRERFPIDEWRLIETRLGDDDGGLTGTLFAVGNGYLGLRADWCPDPQSAGTYVNGFHETFPIKHAEHAHALARTGQTLLNAPDAKSIELDVGGEVLRLAPLHRDQSNVSSYLRTIDFRDGVLRSELIWETTAGVRVKVMSERLVEPRAPAPGRRSAVGHRALGQRSGHDHVAARQPPGPRHRQPWRGEHRPAPRSHVRPSSARAGVAGRGPSRSR